jgi:tetratricopeptide (TPR) repeat protein
MTRTESAVLAAAVVGVAAVLWLVCRHVATRPAHPPPTAVAKPQRSGGQPADLLQAALASEARGRSSEAQTLYRQAIEADTARALEAGRRIAPGADTAKAEAPLHEFHAALSPDAQTTRSHRAVTSAIVDGRLDRAAGLYAQAWTSNPGYARALLRLLERLEETGYVQEATADLLTRMTNEPNRAETHRNIAAVAYAVGDYRQAWEHVHACRRLGVPMDDAFLSVLATKSPEPKDTQH